MSDQEQLLASYAAMTPWAQAKLCKMAGDYAKEWPVAKPKPTLRLVSSRPLDIKHELSNSR